MSRLWTYAWKSSDGTRHEDTMEAENKEAVFTALRERGIKAIRVDQVIRKRDRIEQLLRRFGILALVAAVAAAVAFYAAKSNNGEAQTPVAPNTNGNGVIESDVVSFDQPSAPGDRIAKPLPRKQINTDGLALDRLFKYESEQYLVRFAAPGIVGGVTGELPSDLFDALESPILIRANDTQVVSDLKRIVAGIKQDIALFHSSGKSAAEIADWLKMRQQMEADFRQQLIGGRSKDKASKSAINDKLRAMGLAEIE